MTEHLPATQGTATCTGRLRSFQAESPWCTELMAARNKMLGATLRHAPRCRFRYGPWSTHQPGKLAELPRDPGAGNKSAWILNNYKMRLVLQINARPLLTSFVCGLWLSGFAACGENPIRPNNVLFLRFDQMRSSAGRDVNICCLTPCTKPLRPSILF